MRSTPFVVALAVWAGLGLASVGAAQTVTGPRIHHVTHEGAGLLTISGTGLRADMLVTVDGQPVAVLPGGTERQIEVLAPAALLTTPGTYRLTVVDPVRQVGDAFVVASPAASVAVGRAVSGEPSGGLPAATAAARAPRVTARVVQPSTTGAVVSALIEDACNTAVGVFALASNAGGCYNTASGLNALRFNTTGFHNTGTGANTLRSNTAGSFNTASGIEALYSNTTGDRNTASGVDALFSNTTGIRNTASGSSTLFFNNTGDNNTANGFQALFSNTTASSNTASGANALYWNTSGTYNTASGESALFSNATGIYNTASGFQALYNDSASNNTASGAFALGSKTTGDFNTAFGWSAGYNATAGSYNVFLGADVTGTAADTNTIRIGLPYTPFNGGTGQNKTFIAGIRGTAVIGGLPVVVDATGKMGTAGGATPLGVFDATNTQPSQLRLGFLNGVADYGIGRNPSDGFLDFTATQGTYSGFRFNTPNAGTALAIANNGTVSMMDATNSRLYQLRLGFLNGFADYGIGRNPFDGYLNFAATQGTYSGYRFNTPNAGTAVTIANNGAVGIGVTAPTQPLQLASGAYVSAGGVWTNASSRTLKDYIAPLSTADAIQTVADLSPVTFVYKAAPGEAHVGFIAEDVPALVATQDRRSLATMDLLAVLTKVVQVQQQQLQEQQQQMQEQQEQLHEQDATVVELRTRLTRLEALLAREP